MTIEKAFNEFIQYQYVKGNSEKTIEYYNYCIRPMIVYFGSEFDIEEFNKDNLRNYAVRLRKTGICSNTLKTYSKGVKAFLSYLYNENYTASNCSSLYLLPKAQRKFIDILTDCEIIHLLNSIDTKTELGKRNYLICCLALGSGLRKSEIINIRIDNFRVNEGYMVVTGKGDKQRRVPFGLTAKNAFKAYLGASNRKGNLFLTKQGKPMTESCIERIFKTLSKASLIGRLHCHLLRHTFATNYLIYGGNIYSLQSILGHSDLETVKLYLHLAESQAVYSFSEHSPLDNILKSKEA